MHRVAALPQVRLTLADGSWVELGPVLAKAGEGTIYTVNSRPTLVAKIFHTDLPDLTEKAAKVSAMVGAVPQGAVQDDGFVVLAWPQYVLFRGQTAVGFVMPRIDTAQAVEIHSLSNPSNRANPLPSAPQWTAGATWAHLVTAAANLCLAVDVVHHIDAVIGDFQERNILVANTVRVTLVDCDSMQFADSTGRQFLSPLGRPEFTAPELAKADLRTTARDKTSDLFALAVHIHLLIMAGNHPFMRGVWSGAGEQPDALTLAQRGNWAGGPGSALGTHPLAPPISFLPNDIQSLFVQCFTDGARNPNARPSADQWRRALSRIEIINCHRQPQHQIPAGTDECPWCEIDSRRKERKASTFAPSQKAMPPLGPPQPPPARSSAPAPARAPASAPGPAAGGSRTILRVLAALVFVGLIVAVGVTLTSKEESTTSGQRKGDSPTSTTQLKLLPQTFLLHPSPTLLTPPQQSAWTAVVVGTCDEGGSCGVKQRDAPLTAAPRLVPDDLQDGMTVTVACAIFGDTRSSQGHGSSNLWLRLNNGAFVNSVYLNISTSGIPSC